MSHTKYKKHQLETLLRKIFDVRPNQKQTSLEIFKTLEIKDKNQKKLTLSILINLKKEGFLKEPERETYILNKEYKTTFVGTVDATSSGTAYVVVKDLEYDVYIKHGNINNALDGDKVEIELIRFGKSKVEGRITKIVERKTKEFVGTVAIKQKYAFLIVKDKKINIDLYIPLSKLKNAKNGDLAVGRITSWPKDVDNPFGEIVEYLGPKGNSNVEMTSILYKNQFSSKFPKEVLKEAREIELSSIRSDEIKNRKDCRSKITFTIDPADAKDFDDAISFESLENGNYEVGIHIADVSHYVSPNSAIDKEAYFRGNSVYLEDRVIPMLPEQVSNFVCSLRPNEDKLTFSAIFELTKTGKVISKWFGKTVICSNKRYNYEEAQKIIDGKEDEFQEALRTIDKITKSLRNKRIEKGALNIESEEVRFIIDDEGKPIGVKKVVTLNANKLIEELMLLANKQVALFVGKLPKNKGFNKDFIYRCHDKPDIDKLRTFSIFINKFNYNLAFQNIDTVSKQINDFLETIKDAPEFGMIQSMAIRSMAKATYQTNNIGHYGLAFPYYTHFTAPIRRYGDIIVHRILQAKLENTSINYGNKLNEISKHISNQERKALEAERESNKFFQAKYMLDKIGKTYKGTISGLADFGLFVKMEENYCEGLVAMNALPDDNYYFDIDKFQIKGKHSKFTYNFGDKVSVKVVRVDLNKKQIDLVLTEN